MKLVKILILGLLGIILCINLNSNEALGQPNVTNTSSSNITESNSPLVQVNETAIGNVTGVVKSAVGNITSLSDPSSYLTIVTKVVNNCAPFNKYFCSNLDETSFTTTPYGFVNNEYQNIGTPLPGSHKGYVLDYIVSPKGLQYNVVINPMDKWTAFLGDDCRGILLPQESKVCNIDLIFNPPRPNTPFSPLPTQSGGGTGGHSIPPTNPYPNNGIPWQVNNCYIQYEYGKPIMYCNGVRLG